MEVWKYLEFISPNCNHLHAPRFLIPKNLLLEKNILILLQKRTCKSSKKRLLPLPRDLEMPLNLFNNLLFLLKTLPNTCLFQPHNLDYKELSVSFQHATRFQADFTNWGNWLSDTQAAWNLKGLLLLSCLTFGQVLRRRGKCSYLRQWRWYTMPFRNLSLHFKSNGSTQVKSNLFF